MVQILQLCALFALLLTSTATNSHHLRSNRPHGDLALRAEGHLQLFPRAPNARMSFYDVEESGNECVLLLVSSMALTYCSLFLGFCAAAILKITSE